LPLNWPRLVVKRPEHACALWLNRDILFRDR
jgi:hypothetical protein